MKVVKTIVDKNLRLIGFVLEGKVSEFGGIGTEVIQRNLTIQELSKLGFKNSQIKVTDNSVDCFNGFKISSIGMLVYDNQQFTEIDNSMTVTKRVLVNGKLRGFEVYRGDGITAKYTYENVIRLANYFKPTNFILKRTAKDKIFIAGKGCRIEDLPEIEIGNTKETGKRSRVSGGSKESSEVAGEIEYSGNLLGLYDLIKSCNGIIIKLPDESYESRTTPKEVVADGFVPLGIGEIGNPYIDFGEKKLNANTNFKKLGTVAVNIGGGVIPVYTFTWSTKSIFVNGSNYIKRFGVAVTEDVANKIIEVYGKELITQKITDRKVTEPISSVMGRKDFVFFEVDSSKLSIMDKNKANEYMLNNKELYKTVFSLNRAKAQVKIVKEIIKECEAASPSTSITGTNKPLFGIFSTMNEQALQAIQEAGIDVFTGAYGKRSAVPEGVATNANSSGDNKANENIEIELDISGQSLSGLTLKHVREVMTNKTDKVHKMCTDNIIKMVTKLDEIKDPNQKLEKANQFKEELDKIINRFREILWKYKVAAFTLGDYKELKLKDADKWVEKASRSKKATVFECTEDGCTGLVIKLTNIQISR